MDAVNLRELAALQQFRAEVVSAIRRLDEQLTHVYALANYPRDDSGDIASPEGGGFAAAVPQEVLVRSSPGPKVEVFHSVEAPCGRVHRKGGAADAFRATSLTRALERGLRPCSACDFPASVKAAGEGRR